jgi:hypothetical protein
LDLLEGPRAYSECRLGVLEAGLGAGPVLMAVSGVASVTFVTSGFRSFQEFGGDAGVGAASAGSVGGT